jgi:hypothetical protein
MFQCAPDLFQQQETECVTETHPLAPTIINEDFEKDSIKGKAGVNTTATTRTTLTCGNRTILHAASQVNGVLTYLDLEYSHDIDWIGELQVAYDELVQPNLTAVVWNTKSQWLNHEANVKSTAKEEGGPKY